MPIEVEGGSPFLVPAWVLGTAASVERAINATAKLWAAAYREGRPFPEPKLVSPGAAEIILSPTNDEEENRVAVRFFATGKLVATMGIQYEPPQRIAFFAAYERHVGRYAWGSFDNLMTSLFPTNLATTQRRFEDVLPHLGVLETVTMTDIDQPRTATAVLDRYESETLSNWTGPNAFPLQARIALTLEAMEKATPEWIREPRRTARRPPSIVVGLLTNVTLSAFCALV